MRARCNPREDDGSAMHLRIRRYCTRWHSGLYHAVIGRVQCGHAVASKRSRTTDDGILRDTVFTMLSHAKYHYPWPNKEEITYKLNQTL